MININDVSEAPNDVEPSITRADPLLYCLTYLAKHNHIAFTQAQLLSGLPLVDGHLTPELFIRAAQRINLSARVEHRKLSEISSLVLPAVAILNDNQAVIVQSIDHEKQLCEILQVGSDQSSPISFDELNERYSHYAIYVKSEPQYERRAIQQIDVTKGHWFWDTLKQSWRIYRDVLVASFLINMFALANPLFVMNVYDRVVPNNAIETLWVLAIGIFVVYLFDFLLKSLRVYFIEVAGKKSDILLSAIIFERVLGAKYAEHPTSVGAFAGQLRDFESIRNFITSSSLVAFIDLPFAILFLLVIGYIGGAIVWVPIAIIPVVLIFAWVVQSMLDKAVTHTFVASAQKNATMIEALSNLSSLKILNAEGRALRNLEKAVGLLAFWGVKTRVLSTSATSFAGFMQQVASVVVVIVGVYLISAGDLTMGGLIACVLLTSRALSPFTQVAGLLVQFQQSAFALESLGDIVHRKQERPVGQSFVQRKKLDGRIEFRNVELIYPGDDHPTLKDISFTIKHNEKVALVGRLGSGKSTVHNLISGLYEPSKGSILIDGIDLKQIDPADLRDNIGYAQQDGALFYGSIQDNIAYRDKYIEETEVLRVADIAGVSEFTNIHPQGLSRVVAERGENLSGGQRQSVQLARSLVNSPPIILLDEPSSAMDNSSEAKLLANLEQELADRTLVLVTHKTSLLKLVDRIIVLDQGAIVADGPKDSVLEALKKGQIRVA